MTPEALLSGAIIPAYTLLGLDSPAARVLSLAIAGQESDWMTRLQDGGPARGYWQCESTGAVYDVMDKASQQLQVICKALDIPPDTGTVYEAIAWNDQLAAGVARLALWLDPASLPAVGDASGAWVYYLAVWRPGSPRPGTWGLRYSSALVATGHQ